MGLIRFSFLSTIIYLGVFLLNTVLTVEAGKSNSHKNCGWTDFTDEVIKVIDKELKGVVFLLWGKPA